MAYEVNFTNGRVAKLVEDGSTDSTFSVKLVGKNVTAYGETFAENFIRLLENSANSVAPTNPVIGQVWFNTKNEVVDSIPSNGLGVYDGTKWKVAGGATVQTTEPTLPAEGDLWFDTTNNQLKVYDGGAFLVVGPDYTSVDGKNGPITEVITDAVATSHVITKIYSATKDAPGSTAVLATISKDSEYTPLSPIAGFSTIKPGIQLSSTLSDLQFHGEATSLAGFDVDDFLRATANDTTTGTLGVLNDGGITVGVDSDLTLEVGANDVVIKNNTANGDIKIDVNDGGVSTTVVTIDGSTASALVNADPTVALGIATKQYVDTAQSSAESNANNYTDTAETDAIASANNYTDTAISNLVNSASAGYDTLGEIESQIGSVSSASTSGLALKVDKAGDSMSGLLTLSGAPTNDLHAATKKYVDDVSKSKTIYMSLDTRGLTNGGIASLLNTLAPPGDFLAGTRAHIAGTSQNVTTSTTITHSNWIGITSVSNVTVTTTVDNPTRNNDLIFQVNITGTSWEYVSG